MYLWIFIISCFISFAVTWGIGANDLANSFGTAYGSKVLTLKQIVIIAAFCEFGGALLLGGEVSKTVAGSLTASDAFTEHPYIFMYGMLAALIATAFWLFFATTKKLPVSTTHSIVGAVVGFALVFKGGGGIKWAESHDDFPFVKGVVPVFISWFTSPLLSMAIAMLVFWLLRRFVLRETSASAGTRSAISFVIITFVTMWVNSFFILSKGMKKRVQWPVGQSAWVATLISVGIAAIVAMLSPKLIALAKKQTEEEQRREAEEARQRMRGAVENWKTDEDVGTKAAVKWEQEHHFAEIAMEEMNPADEHESTPMMPPMRGKKSVAQEMQAREREREAAASVSASSLRGGSPTPPAGAVTTNTTTNGTTFVPVAEESATFPNATASNTSNLRARSSYNKNPTHEPISPVSVNVGAGSGNGATTTSSAMPPPAAPSEVVSTYAPSTYAPSAGGSVDGGRRARRVMRRSSSLPGSPTAAGPGSPGVASIARSILAPSRASMSEILPPHDDIEIFHPHAEWLFKYLQIFSSMVISFSHGANDVSNSVGALAAIYAVYETGTVDKEVDVAIWMLALGGVGIVLGLATMGRKIIVVLGEEMVILTPSRGFSAQFAASLVVSFSSSYGLPVSTTHCVTGAVVGIGLIEGASHVEWGVVGRTAVGWIITVVITAVISGVFFAQGIYAPSSDIAFGHGS